MSRQANKSYKSEQIEQIIPRLTPREQGIPYKDHVHEKAQDEVGSDVILL